MADGGFAAHLVYGWSGLVLHFTANALVGQDGRSSRFCHRAVCPVVDGKYFFGGGDSNHRFVPGGGCSGVCDDITYGFFAV